MTRRFLIFLIGVILGVMIIRFAFPGRFSEYSQYLDLNYRVLYHLKSDTIYFSTNAQCHLDCLDIKKETVLEVLNKGKVNFKKSDIKRNPCKNYIVEKNNFSVLFELCDEKVTLKEFSHTFDSCYCY